MFQFSILFSTAKSAAEFNVLYFFFFFVRAQNRMNARNIRRVFTFTHFIPLFRLFPSHFCDRNPLHLAMSFVIELMYFAFRVVYNRNSNWMYEYVILLRICVYTSSVCVLFSHFLLYMASLIT